MIDALGLLERDRRFILHRRILGDSVVQSKSAAKGSWIRQIPNHWGRDCDWP